MIKMPHLPLMEWDFKDELHATSRQVVNDGTPETTLYVYDSTGQRVRKVTERQAAIGETITRKAERIYVGNFEVYREYENDGAAVKLERETLHVMDDKHRMALVETKTAGAASENASPDTLTRYQFANHLGSSSLELDDQAQTISYEEYFPYGSTSYQAVRSETEMAKRYRYTGKERDDETALAYHGVRYYAPWLGRWASCDPIGIGAGLNLFAYCKSNPVRFNDPSGTQSCDTDPINAQEGDGVKFLPKKEAAEKWSGLDLKTEGIQLEEVKISAEKSASKASETEPIYFGGQLREVVIRPNAVFMAFIGGAADKYPFLGQAPTNIMLDVRNKFVSGLKIDTTNSDYFTAKYYGYEDVQTGKIKKDIEAASKVNPQQKLYVVGHSLGGWEGAALTSSSPAKMLITVDPVGTDIRYAGQVSFAEPKVKADKWINILARSTKPDVSDFIAELGGRWHMKEGPSRRDTANATHAEAEKLMKFTPAPKSGSAAPKDSSAWDLLKEEVHKNLLWLK
jgi:RHS repeat-associated protein